ncbi:MAG: GTP-binding protein [Flavobacteriaceae bacterium]|nr:GTP-binding protein [Flavobacteriaceae bacterium]
MSLENEILLRPRFKLEINQNNENALKTFDKTKENQKDFVVSRVDNHVFIRIPKSKQHFWSPQLHLEIEKIDDHKSELKGLFGPKPSVWTMFMFFHFAVIGLFVIVGVWAYTNWSLKTDYGMQIGIMFGLIAVWIFLYFAGRMGKEKGKEEMKQLCGFLEDTLNLKDIKERKGCV